MDWKDEYLPDDESCEQFVRLWDFETEHEKTMAVSILQDKNIPVYVRDKRAGSIVRIMTGGSVFGGALYVPVSCRQAAADAIVPLVSPRGETDPDGFEQFTDFEADAEPEPENESGAKAFVWFVAVFGLLIFAGLLYLLIRNG